MIVAWLIRVRAGCRRRPEPWRLRLRRVL